MTAFLLDPRLEADTLFIGRLALCDARLMRDARFAWIVLIPRRAGLLEIFDLAAEERMQAMAEIARVAEALKRETGCLKINIGALGNIVRQLHIHIVARREGDAAWPGPVWGSGASVPYPEGAAEALADRLRYALGLELNAS